MILPEEGGKVGRRPMPQRLAILRAAFFLPLEYRIDKFFVLLQPFCGYGVIGSRARLRI